MAGRLLALLIATIALAVVVGASAPAGPPASLAQDEPDCTEDPLGPAPDWTVVTHGDLVQANSDSEGRIAVGGNATLSSFGVASKLPVDGSRVDLAVAGNLVATNVGVNNGSIVYGESVSGATAPNGTITQHTFDLETAFEAAARRSSGWEELEPNTTITGPEFGALTLEGDDPVTNVVRIQASQLEQAQRILIRMPFGSTTLINVLGESYSTAAPPVQTVSVEFWNGSSFQQFGNDAPSPELEAMRRAMLWNFPDATFVEIGPNLAWQGSVLAPRAYFSFPGNTQLNGTIIVGSLTGNGESHLHPPDGLCLPDPTPCPPEPPVPTPTPTPTPEPTVTPEPTPEPTATPTPEPTATPAPEPTVPPLGPDQPDEPDAGGTLPEQDVSTDVSVCKKVYDRRGRPVEEVTRVAGRRVRFRLRVTNLGFTDARDVRVCDRIPAGLRLVRAPGSPTLRRGRLCWRVDRLDTQRQAIATFRIRRSVCRRVTNTLGARSSNGGRARNTASVRACRAPLSPRYTG